MFYFIPMLLLEWSNGSVLTQNSIPGAMSGPQFMTHVKDSSVLNSLAPVLVIPHPISS